MTDPTPFSEIEIFHLTALTRDHATRIERLITVAIARRVTHATVGDNGLTGRVDVITGEVTLEALIRGWLDFPTEIGNSDVHCGLMLLQQREVLTITEGRPTVLTITPCALGVDRRDCEPYYGISELEAA